MVCLRSGYLLWTSGSAGLLIRSGYIKKGRLLFAVALADYLNSKAHNNSQYKM